MVPPNRLPLRELAYRKIVDAIREGLLPPNERLSESQIAKWLNMSRTPVRDALRRLTTEGVIAQEHDRVSVVAALDYDATVELFTMREGLEAMAASLAASHSTPAPAAALRDILEEEPEYFDDPEELGKINARFHNAVYQMARNRYLLRSLNMMRESVNLLGRGGTLKLKPTIVGRKRVEGAHREHVAVAEAIARCDPKAAAQAARAHVRAALRERLRLMHTGGPVLAVELVGFELV